MSTGAGARWRKAARDGVNSMQSSREHEIFVRRQVGKAIYRTLSTGLREAAKVFRTSEAALVDQATSLVNDLCRQVAE